MIEGAGIAGGQDMGFVFGSGPADLRPFDQIQRKGDIKGNLNPGTDDFAVALAGVAVAQKEQGPRYRHRKINRNPFDKAPIVHIAAVGRRSRRRYRLAAGGGHAKTPHHRLQGLL